jgi:hypothetical protein
VTVTLVDDDGSIDVGDEVTFSNTPQGFGRSNGFTDSDSIYYLGTVNTSEGPGYIFGDQPTVGASSKFSMLVNTDDVIQDKNEFILLIASSLNPVIAQPDLGTEPACFLPGTLIATPDGPVKVEDLRVGDTIMKAHGRETSVMFVGRQTIGTALGLPSHFRPVRIEKGCLGNGLPKRNLYVTADHAIYWLGMLVNAGALVNDSTITWLPEADLGDSLTVYHVETLEHELILAEGVPCESFVDFAGRRNFDNFWEYQALYREDRKIDEMNLPRITSKRVLPGFMRCA